MKKIVFLSFVFIIIILSGMTGSGNLSGQKSTDLVLWKAGTGNYKNYRIPSIIVTQKGTILAFCEGREGGDSGDIDILMKRSENNGKSWSNEIVIWNDGLNSCGNPCVVEDRETGRIWLIMTWNNGKDNETSIISKESIDKRIPYYCYSDNNGITWSPPVKMSDSCKDPSWGWYATGPGIGIQLVNGKYKGRIVIPANHSYDDPSGNIRNKPYNYGSHVLISDDHGKTWTMSKPIKPGCNESQVVELTDGTLVMNMRSYNNKYCRALSFSRDGGESWSEIQHELQLVESLCQASFLGFGNYKGTKMYLFANPAVPSGRHHMTIKVSVDECRSWSISKLVWSGFSAYSCMQRLPGGNLALFFECGEKNPYETLRFLGFQPKELFQPGTLISGN
jgi:sialidase-1